MAYLLLFLAFAAAVGAAALWAAANRQQARGLPAQDSAQPEPLDAPAATGPTKALAEADGAQDTEEPEDTENPEDTTDTAATVPAAPQPHPQPQAEPAGEVGRDGGQPEAADDEADASGDGDDDVDGDDDGEVAAGSELLPEKRSLLTSLPGAARRERREWAQSRGYDFARQDEYLVDEFTRGAAASGAEPRDIVAGQVLGHEMLLMDIGGVGVMAMRTGAASDVVVDFRRGVEESASEDLVPVMDVAGFSMFASDAAVAERFLDARVLTALEALPPQVTAVWLESEWALAQTTKAARGPQWDAMQSPLALLADAARVLPPRSSAAMALHPEEGDPTRPMEMEAVTLANGPVLVAPPEDEYEFPPVQRPEEPMEMPTRVVGASRGPVAHTALGADEVDAIADGRERPSVDSDTPRIRRESTHRPTIFTSEPPADGPEDPALNHPDPNYPDSNYHKEN